MSIADPTPGDDAPTVAENDRSYLMEQAPVEVDDAAVAAHAAEEADAPERGSDAAAAQD